MAQPSFVVMIVGALVVAAALIVEVSYQPPFWVHALLWIPLIFALSLGLLRPLKAIFYAINYATPTGSAMSFEEPEGAPIPWNEFRPTVGLDHRRDHLVLPFCWVWGPGRWFGWTGRPT